MSFAFLEENRVFLFRGFFVCLKTRDGILGHRFNKRLESFAPCYSQSLSWRVLKKTTLFFACKSFYKKSAKQENLSLFMTCVMRVKNQTNIRV